MNDTISSWVHWLVLAVMIFIIKLGEHEPLEEFLKYRHPFGHMTNLDIDSVPVFRQPKVDFFVFWLQCIKFSMYQHE